MQRHFIFVQGDRQAPLMVEVFLSAILRSCPKGNTHMQSLCVPGSTNKTIWGHMPPATGGGMFLCVCCLLTKQVIIVQKVGRKPSGLVSQGGSFPDDTVLVVLVAQLVSHRHVRGDRIPPQARQN